MFDHIHKKLIASRSFNGLVEFAAACLMDESCEFLGCIADFELTGPKRIELGQGHQSLGLFVHRQEIDHRFHECLREKRPITARIFLDAFVKVLPERFVFLDRRRIEDAVATLAHAHRAGLIETGLLEFPIQRIDVLKEEDFVR